MNDGAKHFTFVVPVIASIFLIAFHYPGTLTNDTYEWITQARTGQFKDAQPLGAVLLLKTTELFYPGPFPFVAINIAAICFSSYAVMRNIMGGGWLVMLSYFAFILYPPVSGLIGIAWRDFTGLALTIITFNLALVGLRSANRNISMYAAGIATAVTLIGCFFRQNHAAGAWPFLAASYWPLLQRFDAKYTRIAAAAVIAFGVGALTTLAAGSVNQKLVTVKTMDAQVRMNYMLSRLSMIKDKPLIPLEIQPNASIKNIQAFFAKYQEYSYGFMYYVWARDDNSVFLKIDDPVVFEKYAGLHRKSLENTGLTLCGFDFEMPSVLAILLQRIKCHRISQHQLHLPPLTIQSQSISRRSISNGHGTF
jgi:hypothetical protein